MRIGIVDGEILTFKCQECNHKFKHIIGYGPVCPSSWLRKKKLKENPPICPHCGSKNVKKPFWSSVIDLIL